MVWVEGFGCRIRGLGFGVQDFCLTQHSLQGRGPEEGKSRLQPTDSRKKMRTTGATRGAQVIQPGTAEVPRKSRELVAKQRLKGDCGRASGSPTAPADAWLRFGI